MFIILERSINQDLLVILFMSNQNWWDYFPELEQDIEKFSGIKST